MEGHGASVLHFTLQMAAVTRVSGGSPPAHEPYELWQESSAVPNALQQEAGSEMD